MLDLDPCLLGEGLGNTKHLVGTGGVGSANFDVALLLPIEKRAV